MKLRATAVILYLISVGFVIYGLYTMFTYGDADSYDYTGHIVGGDAYNYIIIGVRGAGLILVGVVSAIIGNGFISWSKVSPEEPVVSYNTDKSNYDAKETIMEFTNGSN